MKRFLGFAIFCALLAIPAVAAGNSQKVNLPGAVKVGSTVLPAGEYKISWTGAEASAQVTFEKKGVPTLTVTGKVVKQKNDHNGVSTSTQGDKEILQQILLSDVSINL